MEIERLMNGYWQEIERDTDREERWTTGSL